MATNLYVGNLSYNSTEDGLREAFGAFGEVESVNVITDRETGRPRGFAFVQMATEEGAAAAIAGLNERDLDGRRIKVAEARPREQRDDRREGGGYGGSRW
jgi:RNA recognition motif-containing protein